MASQIVMDRTGDTRRIFNNQDRAEVQKPSTIQGTDWRRLYRSGPFWPRRTTDHSLVRPSGGGTAHRTHWETIARKIIGMRSIGSRVTKAR